MKKLLAFFLLMVGSATLQAVEYEEGVNYKTFPQLPTETGDKIEVLEFFWYGCPHCNSFEPYINTWKKSKPANVEFARVPAIFRPDWEIQARAYYALSNMGVIEDIHGKIFKAIHKDKKKLNKKEVLTDFIVSNGIDRKKFEEEYKSFAVDTLVRKAKKMQTAYKIQGVPSVAVNGKYVTSGSMTGSYENLINVINYLIEKESKKSSK
ncbi:Periplasmic thiol:disulfide interchange protein DsbA [hydrothermal vent metagenome]|uniref:Thiol:disulfide interchange protein DsbA n=1 Tax=hydrothermal vent metagenome TaxID=652676 RepID=A0A3B0WVP1_9ZZZZ